MVKYDIIIPTFNQSDMVITCLNSIKKYSTDYRIIFVDNGSTDSEVEKFLPILRTMPHLYLREDLNIGFVRAINLGLEKIKAKYVVLMNNDTEAVENWLEGLAEPCEQDYLIGITGPVPVNRAQWRGGFTKTKKYSILNFDEYLPFFCALIKKEVIEELGGLSERFGIGYTDDLEYCYRAQCFGWDLALVSSVKIPHHGATTFSSLLSRQQISTRIKNNHEIFYSLKQNLFCEENYGGINER